MYGHEHIPSNPVTRFIIFSTQKETAVWHEERMSEL